MMSYDAMGYGLRWATQEVKNGNLQPKGSQLRTAAIGPYRRGNPGHLTAPDVTERCLKRIRYPQAGSRSTE